MKTDLSLTKPSFLTACFLASRPKTLTATAIPAILGTSLAIGEGVEFHGWLFICTLLSALSMQTGINFINDALDFSKGADTEERLGPDRVVQKGWLSFQAVLRLGLLFFLLGFLFGIPLIMQGGFPLVAILASSALLGYFYTGGPYPIAYLGLGEIFVIVFFGFVATLVPYYMQSAHISATSILAGFQMGCLACVLLLINNLRDIHTDAKAKKRTTALRFGQTFAKIELTAILFIPFVINFAWFDFHHVQAAILPFLTLPLASYLVKSIWIIEPSRVYNHFLGMSALLHCLFGALLSIGLLL